MGNRNCVARRPEDDHQQNQHHQQQQQQSYVTQPIRTTIPGLQAELQAAYQESECVKRKLHLQEAEIATMRGKHSSREDEWETKFREFNSIPSQTPSNMLVHFQRKSNRQFGSRPSRTRPAAGRRAGIGGRIAAAAFGGPKRCGRHAIGA